jgi:hypothetical protein
MNKSTKSRFQRRERLLKLAGSATCLYWMKRREL